MPTDPDARGVCAYCDCDVYADEGRRICADCQQVVADIRRILGRTHARPQRPPVRVPRVYRVAWRPAPRHHGWIGGA